ncbi:MAG: ABC transporter ATP-binding protein [Candidatus Hydrothermarchaeota archaeon]
MLQVKGLVAGYGGNTVLHGVDLEVGEGEIVSLVGPNGAGKSTLFRSIFGMADLKDGDILFQAKSIKGLAPHQVVRRGISYVPQGRNIFPTLTVLENLEMGSFLREEGLEERLREAFRLFPVLDKRKGQIAGTMSGGERQMLAIAMALMPEPRLLLLDEPSLGLAPKYIEKIFQEIKNINGAGRTVLLVEQNAYRALEIADRGYVMEMGRIRLEGTGRELLGNKDVQRLYLGGLS